MLKKLVPLFALLLVSSAVWAYGSSYTTQDKAMLDKLAQADNAEIQVGLLVQQTTTQPAVRQFGQRLVNDHTANLSTVQSFARDHKIPLNTQPTAEETRLSQQLSGLTGPDFDNTLIKGMLEDHKKDVAKVADYISDHPNSAITPLLKKTLPVLEDHLRLAENVAGQLGVAADAGLNSGSSAG